MTTYFIQNSRAINRFINDHNYSILSFKEINNVKAKILELEKDLHNYEIEINKLISISKRVANIKKGKMTASDCWYITNPGVVLDINEEKERKEIARFKKILSKNLKIVNEWINLKWIQGEKLPVYKKADFYDTVYNYIIKNNEAELTKYLQNNLSDLNFVPTDQRFINKQIMPVPLLVLACQKGNINIVKMLCQKGAKIDIEHYYFEIVNPNNGTVILSDYFLPPLLTAIKFKNYYIAEFLLEKGGNAKITDQQKNSALHILSKNCNNTVGDNKLAIKMAKMLIEKAVDINGLNNSVKTPICYAITNYKQDFIEFMIKAGANIYDVDEDKNSILNILLLNYANEKHLKFKDEIAMIKFLIDIKIDINRKNVFAKTALHYAVKCETNEFIKLLLETKKTDINAIDINKNTALHILFKNIMFKKEVDEVSILQKVDLLLNAGININAPNYRNWTPLFYAICAVSSIYTKFLIQKGAISNHTTNDGDLALNILLFSHLHIRNLKYSGNLNYEEDCKKIELLLEKNKNLFNIKNQANQTPLYFATIPDDSRYIKLLLSKKVDVLIKDSNDCSVLKFFLKICLEKQEQKMPLDYEQDHKKLKVLIENGIVITTEDINLSKDINDIRYHQYLKRKFQKIN